MDTPEVVEEKEPYCFPKKFKNIKILFIKSYV